MRASHFLRWLAEARRPWLVASIACTLVAAHPVFAVNIVACNETQIYPYSPGCNGVGSCTIEETIICALSCGGACTYNFGSKNLRVQGSEGRFVNGTGFPASISITAAHIGTSTETTAIRFDAGGSGKTLSLASTVGGTDSVLIFGVTKSAGAVAGEITINAAGNAFVGKLDVSATGGGQVGGDVTILSGWSAATGYGTVEASGPGGGGTVTIDAPYVNVEMDINAKSTGSGNAGAVYLLADNDVSIDANVNANVTGSGSLGTGGTVVLGPRGTTIPDVQIWDTVDVGAKNGTAGTITVDGHEVLMNTGGKLLASALSASNTLGGTITISAIAASTFRELEARGAYGGVIKVESNNAMTFQKDINVSSSQAPSGVGGVVSIRTKGRNGIDYCWDCQVPGDTCQCGAPVNCFQTISLEQDILANGNGSSGVGGIITLEAPLVYMSDSTTTKLTANANTAIDGTTGAAPGRIRVRARDSQFVAQTSGGTPHKIRALPDQSLVSEICITPPFGGSYSPAFVVCGPSYAPQCNPG